MSHNRKLGKPTDQRIAMLRAMTTYLLENGQIKTTVSRAKEVAPMAEKMITLAKNANLANYRDGHRPAGVITRKRASKTRPAAGWARFFAYGGRDRKSQPSPCILQEAVLYYTPINQKGDGEPSWTNLRLVAST